MFRRTHQPVPRQRVPALVQQYEGLNATTPARLRRYSYRRVPVSLRESYIADSVSEDSSGSNDYRVAYGDESSEESEGDSQKEPAITRPLSHLDCTTPVTTATNEDKISLDFPWMGWDEINPRTSFSLPSQSNAVEDENSGVLFQQQRERATGKGKVQKLISQGIVVLEKMTGAQLLHHPNERPVSQSSENYFMLRTPKQMLESKPSIKSRTKRAAKNAVQSILHVPKAGVEHAREATTQTARSIRKNASRTNLLVREKIEDAKAKVSTSSPWKGEPRKRYRPRDGSRDKGKRPLIEHTRRTPGSRPWTVPSELEAPWHVDVAPLTPTAMGSEQRASHQNNDNSGVISELADESCDIRPRLPNIPPPDAIFTEALLSDVQWQAKDTVYPLIIVTDEAATQGSWYLPVNSMGQIELRYDVSRRSISSGSSVDSYGSFRSSTSHWSVRSSNGSLDSVEETYSRNRGAMAEFCNDQTPLLIEYLGQEELERREGGSSRKESRFARLLHYCSKVRLVACW